MAHSLKVLLLAAVSLGELAVSRPSHAGNIQVSASANGVAATFDFPEYLAGLTPGSPQLFPLLLQYPAESFLLIPEPASLQETFDAQWAQEGKTLCDILRPYIQTKDRFGTGQSGYNVVCNFGAKSSVAYLDRRNAGSTPMTVKLALGDTYQEPTFGPPEVNFAFVIPNNHVDFNVTTNTPLGSASDPLMDLTFSLVVQLKLAATPVSDIDTRARVVPIAISAGVVPTYVVPPVSVTGLSAHVFSGSLSTRSLLPKKDSMASAVATLVQDGHEKDLSSLRATVESSFATALYPLMKMGFVYVKAIGLHGETDVHLALAGGSSAAPPPGTGRLSGVFWWKLSEVQHVASRSRPRHPAPGYVSECEGISAAAAVQTGDGAWTNFPPVAPTGVFMLAAYHEAEGLGICDYTVTGLPERLNVRINPAISQSFFKNPVTIEGTQPGFFQIPGLPSKRTACRVVSTTPQSPRGVCGDVATNFNFQIANSPPLP